MWSKCPSLVVLCGKVPQVWLEVPSVIDQNVQFQFRPQKAARDIEMSRLAVCLQELPYLPRERPAGLDE